MTGDQAPNALYLALAIMLVASSLVGTRMPIGKAAKMGLAWVAIFGAAFVLFALRSDFSALGQRLKAEATGQPIFSGDEMRIPMAEDGHFWIEGVVNGQPVRFLVDSGASNTTVSGATASEAGIEIGRLTQSINTANGIAQVHKSYADHLQIGAIERTDFPVDVNSNNDTNLLGMNFLSSLGSWRVEGNYLVLRP
jgi:aspartyl protease family protein